jgi:hypothetical protein
MRREIRIKHHLVGDILAFVAGGTLVDALYRRSWLSLILSIVNGVALFIEEKADIEEEDSQ